MHLDSLPAFCRFALLLLCTVSSAQAQPTADQADPETEPAAADSPTAETEPAPATQPAPEAEPAPSIEQAPSSPPTPTTLPDQATLEQRRAATLQQIQRGSVSWTSIQELPGGRMVQVVVRKVPGTWRMDFQVNSAEGQTDLATVIGKGGSWYVREGDQRSRYRPYEANLQVPDIYLYMRSAYPRLLSRVDESVKLLGVEEGLATVQTPLPTHVRRQLEAYQEQLRIGRLQARSSLAADKLLDRSQQARQMLRTGMLQRVHLESMIITHTGLPGNRMEFRDLELDYAAEPDTFDVTSVEWTDFTSPLQVEDRNQLMILHYCGSWRPGMPPSNVDGIVLDASSGSMRRIPYSYGLTTACCFSHDRQKVYATGSLPGTDSIGLFEIDLESRASQRLGGRRLQQGTVTNPVLSPDGTQLAILHQRQGADQPGAAIHVVDLQTGTSKPIASEVASDTLSWLPDGDGLVFWRQRQTQQRRSRRGGEGQPAMTASVVIMDLNGKSRDLCEGVRPVVLPHARQILYLQIPKSEDGTFTWRRCDLQGNDLGVLGDGLQEYQSPAPSPDGKHVLMIRFEPDEEGVPQQPWPYSVSLATGEPQRLEVPEGLWMVPSW